MPCKNCQLIICAGAYCQQLNQEIEEAINKLRGANNQQHQKAFSLLSATQGVSAAGSPYPKVRGAKAKRGCDTPNMQLTCSQSRLILLNHVSGIEKQQVSRLNSNIQEEKPVA